MQKVNKALKIMKRIGLMKKIIKEVFLFAECELGWPINEEIKAAICSDSGKWPIPNKWLILNMI